MHILLVLIYSIDGYYINAYWCLFYWWLLMHISGDFIGDYYIGGY